MFARVREKRSIAFISIICMLVINLKAFAQSSGTSEDPMAWLDRMQKAAVETNYRGTFVFSRGAMSSTVQVVHRYQDDMEHERLTQLDGEMGEVIRRGHEVMCVLPNNRVVKVEKNPISNRLVEAFSGFMPKHGFYALTVDGYDRVIGRSAVRLNIDAQDKNRYSYRLWLDQETSLLLKSLLLSPEKDELERFQYSVLEFPEMIEDGELDPMRKGAVVAHEVIPSVKKDVNWPGQMGWQVSWVPPGYQAQGKGVGPGANVMLYSDGLSTFSVFVEPALQDSMPEGASMVGGTVAYFHRVMDGAHTYGVTVMGEIPPMTAMMVAESVKPDMSSMK